MATGAAARAAHGPACGGGTRVAVEYGGSGSGGQRAGKEEAYAEAAGRGESLTLGTPLHPPWASLPPRRVTASARAAVGVAPPPAPMFR